MRRLVSEEMAEWIVENFGLLITACDLRVRFQQTPLALPINRFFRAGRGRDHKTAIAVFEDVKKLMGVADREYVFCRLNERPEGMDHHTFQPLSDVGGTYAHDTERPIISYNPANVHHPMNFISTLAHELAHDLLTIPEIDPDSPEHELQTDLLCIIIGFGVIQAMGARQAGWAGYLSNESRMFALALFLNLREIPADLAAPHLDGHLIKKLKRGIRQLETVASEISDLKSKIASPPPC